MQFQTTFNQCSKRTAREKKDQETKSTGRMPWHQEPMKDATSCEKPRLGAHIRLRRGCPNGETRQMEGLSPYRESIAVRREPGELKHLSTRRKRKKHRFLK